MSERPGAGELGDGDDPIGPDGPEGSSRSSRPGRPLAGPSRSGALRTFLTSNTGGGMVALAAVLLVVVVLLATRSTTGNDASGQARHPAASSTGATRTPGPASSSAVPSTAPATRPATTTAHPATPKPRPDGSTTHRPAPPADHLPLTVLNDTLVHGLAQQAADTFSSHGWRVTMVGNYAATVPVPTTTVYYTPGRADEQRAARTLVEAFPRISRVLPHDPHLPVTARGVIVVIAPDWQA